MYGDCGLLSTYKYLPNRFISYLNMPVVDSANEEIHRRINTQQLKLIISRNYRKTQGVATLQLM